MARVALRAAADVMAREEDHVAVVGHANDTCESDRGTGKLVQGKELGLELTRIRQSQQDEGRKEGK